MLMSGVLYIAAFVSSKKIKFLQKSSAKIVGNMHNKFINKNYSS